MGNEPFLWMANKDIPDNTFDQKAQAQRLPNSRMP
jgi:hypothetical protein